MSDKDTLKIIAEARNVFAAARKGLGKAKPKKPTKPGANLGKASSQINAIIAMKSMGRQMSGGTPYNVKSPAQRAREADIHTAAKAEKHTDAVEKDAIDAFASMKTHAAKVKQAGIEDAAKKKLIGLSGGSTAVQQGAGKTTVKVSFGRGLQTGMQKTLPLPMHPMAPKPPSDGAKEPSVKVGAPTQAHAQEFSAAQIKNNLFTNSTLRNNPHELLNGHLSDIKHQIDLSHALGSINKKQHSSLHNTLRQVARGHLERAYRDAKENYAKAIANAPRNDREYHHGVARQAFADEVGTLNTHADYYGLRARKTIKTTTPKKFLGIKYGTTTTQRNVVKPLKFNTHPAASYDDRYESILPVIQTAVLREWRTMKIPVGDNQEGPPNINMPKQQPVSKSQLGSVKGNAPPALSALSATQRLRAAFVRYKSRLTRNQGGAWAKRQQRITTDTL